MRYVPHEYQEYAKEFIIRERVSALFLDCGLGKTVITLTAVWELLFDYFDIRKVLVIAPLRVARDTWGGELEKWEHLSGIGLSKVLGPEKERLAALEREAQVYVINRENVEWLVDSCRWEFDMVVSDELSSFKSHKAKRFMALKRVRLKGWSTYGRRSGYWIWGRGLGGSSADTGSGSSCRISGADRWCSPTSPGTGRRKQSMD